MNSAAFFVWAAGVLLVSMRLATLFLLTPVFGGIPVPNIARVVLIFGISAGFASGLHFAFPQHIQIGWLVSTMISELVIGAAMTSALFAGFGAFYFGGRLLDFQIGFGIAGLVDIATKNNAPLLGSILAMLAALVFFSIDGHLVMLRMLQLSFSKMPIGVGILGLNLGSVIAYFSTCFVLGFAIVAPVVLCLFMIDIGMAFMSRTMPQMNVFVMSLSVKVVVGLMVLAIVVPFSGGLIQSVFESIFNQWTRMFE